MGTMGRIRVQNVVSFSVCDDYYGGVAITLPCIYITGSLYTHAVDLLLRRDPLYCHTNTRSDEAMKLTVSKCTLHILLSAW
jgi:hypothetical protein